MMDVHLTSQSSAATPVRCSTCEMLHHAPLACQDCHDLLNHVQGADYFELFGLPRGYNVDLAELGRRYLSISRNIHPDKFAADGAEMQSFALRMSATVNKAHDVLRDPFLRAEYLLESVGGPSAAQDKSVPGSLLTDVMTLREEIEEARDADDTAALQRIKDGLNRSQAEVLGRIESLCLRLDTGDEAAKTQLRQNLNALKYWNNLLGQLAAGAGGARL